MGVIFLTGFHADFLVALMTTLPLLFWFAVVRDRAFGRPWQKILLTAGCWLFWTVQVFLLFTEYYFFDEFKSRFNTVAVDYLLYPTEVFGNIRESYPLNTVLAVCGVAGLAWVLGAFWYFRQMWFQPTSRASRFLHLGTAVIFCVLLLPTVNLTGTRFSSNRMLNEIA